MRNQFLTPELYVAEMWTPPRERLVGETQAVSEAASTPGLPPGIRAFFSAAGAGLGVALKDTSSPILSLFSW